MAERIYDTRRPVFLPEAGNEMVVDFPGERLRCLITRRISHNYAIVELTGMPMVQPSRYKRGDLVAIKRTQSNFGERWLAVEEPIGRNPESLLPPEAFREEIHITAAALGQEAQEPETGASEDADLPEMPPEDPVLAPTKINRKLRNGGRGNQAQG